MAAHSDGPDCLWFHLLFKHQWLEHATRSQAITRGSNICDGTSSRRRIGGQLTCLLYCSSCLVHKPVTHPSCTQPRLPYRRFCGAHLKKVFLTNEAPPDLQEPLLECSKGDHQQLRMRSLAFHTLQSRSAVSGSRCASLSIKTLFNCPRPCCRGSCQTVFGCVLKSRHCLGVGRKILGAVVKQPLHAALAVNTTVCVQDKQRSDSMTRACDIMHLQGLMRHAVKILKGTRILLTGETFHVAAVSVIPVIKVAERCAPSPTCL